MPYRNRTWSDIFGAEIKEINNTEVLLLLDIVFEKIGDYHKIAPASSTGNYHPKFGNGDGGLVRHTKVVARNVMEFIRANPKLEQHKSELIAAALLHDLLKYPNNNISGTEYTDSRHPTLMSNLITNLLPTSETAKIVASYVICHQGREEWNTNRKTHVLENPPPKTEEEWALHYADLLASRKYINCDFDDNGDLILQ